MRDELALASGTSLSCVDVLGLRSQKGSSNFKVVEPFSNGLIALKGKKRYGSPIAMWQVEDSSHKDFYKNLSD